MPCKWLHHNKLYATTTITGFGFINESKTTVEKAFWYLIIIGFSSITIISLASSVHTYLSNPTMTTVTISSADDDMQPFYIIVSLPLFEFHHIAKDTFTDEMALSLLNNTHYHETYLEYINKEIVKQQRELFDMNKTKAVLDFWLTYLDIVFPYFYYDLSFILTNKTCSDAEIFKELSEIPTYEYADYDYVEYNFEEEKENCLKEKGYSDKVKGLLSIIGHVPTMEELSLNVLLLLYTLQDSFNQELHLLEQSKMSIFVGCVNQSCERSTKTAKEYYVDEMMRGGSHVGYQLIDAAQSLNKSTADILEMCNRYFQMLFGLHYKSDSFEGWSDRVDLILQGIQLIPEEGGRFSRLELRFFPNISESHIHWKDYSSITKIRMSSHQFQRMYWSKGVKNETVKQDLKQFYKEHGFVMKIEQPDDVDGLTANWGAGIYVKPYMNAVFNYVIGAKHVQNFNKSCNKNNTKIRCLAKCKGEIFNNSCNCLPWELSTDYDPRPMCHSEQCIIGNQFNKCKQLCAFCETTVWRSDVTMTISDSADWSHAIITIKHLKKINTIYPVFIEDYRYTIITFLAEIGGQMDLWIGCNVIGLLHIIVFICKRILQWILPRKTTLLPQVIPPPSIVQQAKNNTEKEIVELKKVVGKIMKLQTTGFVQQKENGPNVKKQMVRTKVQMKETRNDKKWNTSDHCGQRRIENIEKDIVELKLAVSEIKAILNVLMKER